MPAGLRLLRPESRTEAVDPAEGRDRRLEVELPRLGEERLVAEVVGLEERRGPLAGRRRQDRRVDAHEVAAVEEVVDPLLDLAAHLERRALAAGAQPEVAVLHQEGGAVVLRGDREVVGQVIDPEVGELDLDAGGRALVLLDHARQMDRGLLRHPLDVGPGRLGDVGPARHRLHDAAAVTDLEEADLAARALLHDPAAQGDALADMVLQTLDGGCQGSHGTGHCRNPRDPVNRGQPGRSLDRSDALRRAARRRRAPGSRAASPARQRSARRRLLGALLRPPDAPAGEVAADAHLDGEDLVVIGTALLHDAVDRQRPAARLRPAPAASSSGRRRAVRAAARWRSRGRPHDAARRVEAGVEIDRAEQRLEHIREERRLEAPARTLLARPEPQPLAEGDLRRRSSPGRPRSPASTCAARAPLRRVRRGARRASPP